MNLNRILFSFTLAAATGVLTLAAPARAQQATTVAIDNDDIGGVVAGPNGPEAGVWVIAETTELPTKFAKIVVTNDQGRYLIPDLPPANYSLWVRGYARRLAKSPGNSRQSPQPERSGGAKCGRGGTVLSGDLLVLHAQDPGLGAVGAGYHAAEI